MPVVVAVHPHTPVMLHIDSSFIGLHISVDAGLVSNSMMSTIMKIASAIQISLRISSDFIALFFFFFNSSALFGTSSYFQAMLTSRIWE
jgi:hypothetical protein